MRWSFEECIRGQSRDGRPAAVGRMHGPAKISDLQLPLHAQQQILRLDVPVDDML